MNEAFRVVAAFCAMLGRLGVRHLIGGSLASSVHGVPRATQGVDLVADLQPAHAKRLSELARVEFHVDERAVESAISDVASFNALHRETVFKVDVFVAGDDPWVVEELRRARIVEIPDVGRLLLPRSKTSSCTSCDGTTRAVASRSGSGVTSWA